MSNLTQTTLSAAVTVSATQLTVASATGIAAGSILMIDREFLKVQAVSGTTITVARGTLTGIVSAHPSGSGVFAGTPDQFIGYDKAGYEASPALTPLINIHTGQVFNNVNGMWVPLDIASIGGATNYGLSPLIWNDCPLDKMLVDPGYGSAVGDDFLSGVLATAHMYSLLGANGTFAQVANVPHGAALLSAPATDEDEATVTAPGVVGLIKADAASSWWFETRIKLNRITTDQAAFVGLAGEGATEIDAAFLVDATGALKVVDSIGFRILAPTPTVPSWDTIIQLAGGAIVEVEEAVLASTTSYIKLGMKCVAGTVTFYVNGSPLATQVLSSAANFPLDQVMSAVWAVKALAVTSTTTITIDWWKAAQTRIAN
jgi:hypothetical protein